MSNTDTLWGCGQAVEAGYCVVAEEERVLNEKEIRDFYKDRADEVGIFCLQQISKRHFHNRLVGTNDEYDLFLFSLILWSSCLAGRSML